MNWMLFYPELFYLMSAVILLGVSLINRARPGRDYGLALMLSALGVAGCLASVKFEGVLFLETYRIDLFSQVFKVILSLGLFLVVFLCSPLEGIEEKYHPESYMLLFLCTLAMMMLVSGAHMLSIYVALELSSYCLYVLVSLRRDRRMGIEAGLKYFLVGVCASAIMLFGLALLYGATQAAYAKDLMQILPELLNRPLVAIALVLTLGGFFFKLAVFPFHFWIPDVYQGAANQIGTYIATVSKVAAIAVLIRIISYTGGDAAYLADVLVALAVISMTVGNLAAIAQKDFKRLLAFSSIAHAGYVLIGILSMNPAGYAGAVFYAQTVLVLKFTCFLVVVKVSDNGENMTISRLAGLHRRSPLLAMALMLALFGLAGIPPTIGFTGKLLIFTAAMSKGYFALVLIAMINVVISLYYYLLVLKAAYLDEPEEPSAPLSVSLPVKILTVVLVLVIVTAGIYPDPLVELSRAASGVLM